MKKLSLRPFSLPLIFLLSLSVLFVFGCGGGGGGGVGDNAGEGGGDYTGSDAGFITLQFGQPDAPGEVSALATSANWARIVIRKLTTIYHVDPEYGDWIEVRTDYKDVYDLSIPGTATIPVPPGEDYRIDILTFNRSGALNDIYQHGFTEGVDIVPGDITTVTITLGTVTPTLTGPGSVASGAPYNFSLNASFPLRSGGYVAVNTTGTGSYPTVTLGPGLTLSASPSFTAPTLGMSDTERTAYYTGYFFLDDSLLDTGDLWYNWHFGPVQGTFTIVPPGGIIIIIE